MLGSSEEEDFNPALRRYFSRRDSLAGEINLCESHMEIIQRQRVLGGRHQQHRQKLWVWEEEGIFFYLDGSWCQDCLEGAEFEPHLGRMGAGMPRKQGLGKTVKSPKRRNWPGDEDSWSLGDREPQRALRERRDKMGSSSD